MSQPPTKVVSAKDGAAKPTQSATKPAAKSTQSATKSAAKPTQSATKPAAKPTQSAAKPVTKPTQPATKSTPSAGSGFKSAVAQKKPTPVKKTTSTATADAKKDSKDAKQRVEDIEGAAKLLEKVKIEEQKVDEISIPLAQIANVIFDDKTQQIAKTNKWPLVLDKNGNVETFMRYRDVNFLDTFNPGDLEEKRLRLAFLGALRFGKEVVVNTHNQLTAMWGIFSEKLNAIHPTLLVDIMSRKIVEDDYYKNLAREEDSDEYTSMEFNKSQMYELNKKFKIVILTEDEVIEPFKCDWFIITVN
ncbi:hypothetical protein LOD99_15381 [Oopsacas minuta]|uniref:Uncharacterized protein n=1 Tax=Oopsacas minuta TaxID=111878 RepID=A0AAV7KAV8_9METZ|nr:hypothetical protein LOD99_15381 [Oopsacas minuta]